MSYKIRFDLMTLPAFRLLARQVLPHGGSQLPVSTQLCQTLSMTAVSKEGGLRGSAPI
ncbi:hypothetical protein [Streptococcus acidominimus]|uniref:hypothetical protein n=1 Tax=Streptococcus acidominimus TaxID=1326 RepID=UPI001FD49C60|nr:hypothetical protein [Streptococcus acidominimus]